MNLLTTDTAPIWPALDHDNRGPFDAYQPVEETTVAEPTPAQKLAGDLAVVATHLARYPDLPKVHITPGSHGPISLQCAGYSTEGWTSAEQQTAAWAETLPGATITADCWTAPSDPDRLIVTIKVGAEVDGIPVEVWDASDAPARFGLEPDEKRGLTLDGLRALIPSAEAADRG